MVVDEVSNLIRNDKGILLYAYTLFEKGGESAYNEISSELRNISRFIMEYRKISNMPDATAFSLIQPGEWDHIVESMKSLVHHKGDEQVGVPTLLLRVGRSLEAIVSTKRAWGI